MDMSIERRLDRLKRDFDRGFIEKPPEPTPRHLDLIGFGAEGQRYAWRLTQLAALQRIGKVIPLPHADPCVMGIVGLSGRLVPVYNMPALLGHDADARDLGWLALVAGSEEIGLAFGEWAGHIAVASDAIASAPSAPGDLAPDVLRGDIFGVRVIDVPAVVAHLSRHNQVKKEQVP